MNTTTDTSTDIRRLSAREAHATDRRRAEDALHGILKSGDTVYTQTIHRSASGRFRTGTSRQGEGGSRVSWRPAVGKLRRASPRPARWSGRAVRHPGLRRRGPIRAAGPYFGYATKGMERVLLTEAERVSGGYDTWDDYLDAMAGPIDREDGGSGAVTQITGTLSGTVSGSFSGAAPPQ